MKREGQGCTLRALLAHASLHVLSRLTVCAARRAVVCREAIEEGLVHWQACQARVAVATATPRIAVDVQAPANMTQPTLNLTEGKPDSVRRIYALMTEMESTQTGSNSQAGKLDQHGGITAGLASPVWYGLSKRCCCHTAAAPCQRDSRVRRRRRARHARPAAPTARAHGRIATRQPLPRECQGRAETRQLRFLHPQNPPQSHGGYSPQPRQALEGCRV